MSRVVVILLIFMPLFLKAQTGCSDPDAQNYYCLITTDCVPSFNEFGIPITDENGAPIFSLPPGFVDDGSCEYPGCTDSEAENYDVQANQDNGTCEYPEQNFDCYGDCLVEEDCLGVCNGPAEIDECGVCNGYGISQECGCGPPGEYGFPDDSCNCDGDVEDCLGICGGDATIDCNGVCDGDANCNINISLAPNEFENLVLLTNLNIEEIQESICIDSAQFSTINELNVEIGGCIEVNNAETIQIYITN